MLLKHRYDWRRNRGVGHARRGEGLTPFAVHLVVIGKPETPERVIAASVTRAVRLERADSLAAIIRTFSRLHTSQSITCGVCALRRRNEEAMWDFSEHFRHSSEPSRRRSC